MDLKKEFFKEIVKTKDSEEFINWVAALDEEKSLGDIEKTIMDYVKLKRYTHTLEILKDEYKSHRQGYYISYTAEDVIKKFKKEFEIMFLQGE